MNDELIVVEGVYGLEQNVFATKLGELLNTDQHRFEVWAWTRSNEEIEFQPTYRRHLIQRTHNASGVRLAFAYMAWMWRVFFQAATRRADAVYFCSRFDSALPIAVASLFRRRRFIFANRDNVTTSYAWPRLLKRLLQALETWVARRATIHLVPGESRWPRSDSNLRIIPNTPSRRLLEEANHIATERGYSRGNRFVVYVNGWLTETRGMRTLVDALRSMQDPSALEVLIAGEAQCEAADELLRLPMVHHVGRVSATESLALYHRSHVAFTYYDPAIAINRLAEPNKWGDCVATATPFIANSEILTARRFVDADACFSLAYDDVRGLASLLTRLNKERDEWRRVRAALQSFNAVPWDDAMRRVLSQAMLDESHITGAFATPSR